MTYFTTGWRTIIRDKFFSAINVFGLAAGMAVTILIALWIYDELTYNGTFANRDRIAQVYHHVTFGSEEMTIPDVPAPIAEALTTMFDDFEEVALATYQTEHLIAFEEKRLTKPGLFVDPSFLKMFSVSISGAEPEPLEKIHSILLAESLAADLFRDNPVGKTIRLNNRDVVTVTGIFRDFASNSAFGEVKMLLPMAYYFSLDESKRKQEHNWESYTFQCFVLLREKTLHDAAQNRIGNLLYDNASADGKALAPKGILFPMKDWHLYEEFNDGTNTGGRIQNIWMFGTIGVFVLLLACINFMTLSTARSEKRAKEVGIRKTLGSGRLNLVFLFLAESWMIVAIAFSISVVIAALVMPWFNDLTGKKLAIPWYDVRFMVVSVGFVIVTGVLAGSYPALFLSGFNPVRVLKGVFRASGTKSLGRRILVVAQFSVSIILIVGTMVVFHQIQYARNRPVGFDKEHIFHLNMRTDGLVNADYNSLRHELLSCGVVENMAASDFPVTGGMAGDASITLEGLDPAEKPLITMNSCSHDFPATNGFQIIRGRDFSREIAGDSSAVIINELAARLFPDDPIGKQITVWNGKPRQVIGVIKDQIRWTPYSDQTPHIYYVDYSTARFLTIRLLPGADVPAALEKVETVIRKFDPEAPFSYTFQDDDYARLFNNEERLGKLAAIFSALAIMISTVGIFGLALFTASQRTREIGIRKVLGASVFTVWKMLSGEFVRLVLMANVIGLPAAYYLCLQWLQQYDYRVSMSWNIFAGTALLAIVVTLLTVSYHALSAATKNPASTLRME